MDALSQTIHEKASGALTSSGQTSMGPTNVSPMYITIYLVHSPHITPTLEKLGIARNELLSLGLGGHALHTSKFKILFEVNVSKVKRLYGEKKLRVKLKIPLPATNSHRRNRTNDKTQILQATTSIKGLLRKYLIP